MRAHLAPSLTGTEGRLMSLPPLDVWVCTFRDGGQYYPTDVVLGVRSSPLSVPFAVELCVSHFFQQFSCAVVVLLLLHAFSQHIERLHDDRITISR